jgi:hypothetical protein
MEGSGEDLVLGDTSSSLQNKYILSHLVSMLSRTSHFRRRCTPLVPVIETQAPTKPKVWPLECRMPLRQ